MPSFVILYRMYFVFRWYLLSIQILCFAGIFCLYRFCVSLVFFCLYRFCVSLVSFVYTDFVFRLYSFVYTDFVCRWYLLSIQILCFAGIFCLYKFCVSLVFFCLYRFSFYCTVTSNTFIFKTLTYEEILSAYNFLKIFKCYDYPITAKN